MIKVYIASAYTIGDAAENVKLQIDCANELMNIGFAPYAPLASHLHHIVHPRKYEDWLKFDFEWVKACNCLLRLSGKSKGADREVEYAIENNKPVFRSISEIISAYEIITSK